MKDGNYHVECSDEGLMCEEIADCLRPVIQAVAREGGKQAKTWATAMTNADRVGIVCETELAKLLQ